MASKRLFWTNGAQPEVIPFHPSRGPQAHKSHTAYLEYLAAQGSSHKTRRVAAEVIYRAAVYMRLDFSSPVERSPVFNLDRTSGEILSARPCFARRMILAERFLT